MNPRFLTLLVLSSSLMVRAIAADETEAEPKPHMKDVLKARIEEEAKKQANDPAAKAPPPGPVTPKSDASTNPAAATPTAKAPVSKESSAVTVATPPAPAPAKPAQEAPTVLPKVEVKKDRITVLDHQLQEQDKEIAREKKNTKPTELDKALNDSKVSNALSILGGQSNQYRAGVASERVSLMEDEKDLLEQIAHAKTKAEKQELQKQLDEIRAMRRELEKNQR